MPEASKIYFYSVYDKFFFWLLSKVAWAESPSLAPKGSRLVPYGMASLKHLLVGTMDTSQHSFIFITHST